MKKYLFIILTLTINGFSQEYQKPATGNIFTGASVALGDGSEDMNLGFNLGGAVLGNMNRNVSIGAMGAFNRWTLDVPSGIDVEGSVNYIEVLGLVRFSTTPSNNASAFLQLGGGLFFGTAKLSAYGQSDSDSESDLGINLGGGIIISKVLVMPNFKLVFTEADGGTKWLSLSIGVNI